MTQPVKNYMIKNDHQNLLTIFNSIFSILPDLHADLQFFTLANRNKLHYIDTTKKGHAEKIAFLLFAWRFLD